MSRFNQFAGSSSKLNVAGADSVEGRMVLSASEPIILSWVAQCRLQAQQSGLAVISKQLTSQAFVAEWTMLNGQETLTVNVKAVPQSQERPQPETPEAKEEEFAEMLERIDFTPEQYEVLQDKVEQIQIANELEPIPPEEIKCLVVLFDDSYIVMTDMRTLKGGKIANAPLIGPVQTMSDWELPEHVEVRRLRDYFGQAAYGGSNQDRWDYVFPYTLQMTNNEKMGPVAVAGVSFSGGIFSHSNTHQLYVLKEGFASTAPLDAKTQPGQVGASAGFPALNATENLIYACTQTFTFDGARPQQFGSDVYGHDGDLVSTYSVPSPMPLSPRFIDSDGEAYFQLGYPFALMHPAMGERWMMDFLSSSTETDFNYAYSVSLTSMAGSNSLPVLTQRDKIDVLENKKVDVRSYLVTSDLGSNTYYDFGSAFTSQGSPGAVFCVPYPPDENSLTYVYTNEDGELELKSDFLNFSESGYSARPIGSGPEPWHMFTGFMQVSNGEHNLQGFALHGKTYNTGNQMWDVESRKFYLDGNDVTSALESLCGTSADSIQYAFMDVPFLRALEVKRRV